MALVSGWFVHPRFVEVAGGGGLIRSGERGDSVRVLQSALLRLGQPLPVSTARTGQPDGIFGQETDSAVRNFQRQALPQEKPDGIVGPKTLGALDAKLVGSKPPAGGSLIWGRAPSRVPGAPSEVDLGPILGFHRAEKQGHDMACWAACLSFWGRFCGGGRPNVPQGQLLAAYADLVQATGDRTGGMPNDGLRAIAAGTAVTLPIDVSGVPPVYRWKGLLQLPASPSSLTYDWLKANTGATRAIYYGYSIGGAAHINVIGHYDFEGTSLVWAMEPWDGRFKLREIDYYRAAEKAFFFAPMS